MNSRGIRDRPPARTPMIACSSQEAKNDDWNRELHRLLNVVHSTCDEIVDAIHTTGDTSRDIKQLEDQISQLRVTQSLRAIAQDDASTSS